MKKELQEKFYKNFPKLYQQHKLPASQTCMCWGICCGDGWYDLLWELSEKLESMGVQAVQVKEKLGTLRFYTDLYNEEISKLIREACDKSSVICEVCGNPGSLRTDGWWETLCNKCYEKQEV